MSRYFLRKRKQPPEDVSKFISTKRRKIDADDISEEDEDYSPRLLDASDEVEYPRKDSNKAEKSDIEEFSSEKGSDSSSCSEILSWTGSEDVEISKEEDMSFNPKKVDYAIYDELIDSIVKKTTEQRSRQIDTKYLEKLAETEQQKAAELTKIAEQIQSDLDAEEPDIVKILSTPMTDKDRKRMVQIYEIYKNTIEHTPDHLELRTRIIRMLESFSGANLAENQRVELEIARITSAVPKTDVLELKRRIVDLDADDNIKAKLLEMYREMDETSIESTQYRNLKEKLEWGVSLPYRKVSIVTVPQTPEDMNVYCVNLRDALDREIFGMDEVKEEMIALRVNQLSNPGARSTLALEGPPGVGKTTICEVFAKAVGKPFERVALGGLQTTYLLKGSDNHFVGSTPSILLAFLRSMKIADGYVLLDEIDKLGGVEGHAVQDALLHITDYTQNKEFRDTFLSEFPHDISKMCFMYGMNDRNKINPILRDRLTIVEVEAYNTDQLKQIIKNYVLPKALRDVGLASDIAPLVTIDDSGCNAIIGNVSSHFQETGVRKVDEAVRKIVVRINLLRMVTLQDGTLGQLKLKYRIPNFKLPFVINRDAVNRLLSPPKKVIHQHLYS